MTELHIPYTQIGEIDETELETLLHISRTLEKKAASDAKTETFYGK